MNSNMTRWFYFVLEQEGLRDWNIKYTTDAYCWRDIKTIDLPEDSAPALFLHEVAHAIYQEPEPYGDGMHYHGGEWASTFGKLITKYMKPSIEHMNDLSVCRCGHAHVMHLFRDKAGVDLECRCGVVHCRCGGFESRDNESEAQRATWESLGAGFVEVEPEYK